ncbi:actin-related protein 2/3 complex subunit 1, putative [Hepatocystis sp. ex Piliocolobus tephrosceles]|nr:actin-related protein 2/3 complex subunit 1, putative [Hepatocystis sp. ex Piliocolobus tephrosceles]
MSITSENNKVDAHNITIDHLKCNCVSYSIPDEEYETPIKVSINKEEMLVGVVNNKKNIVLYKIVDKQLIYNNIIYTGSSNKVVGLEWSNKNDLLVVTIDMNCIIYNKNENNKWECTSVNIPTEELPTCVCWHPYCNAFAIGFSSGVIFICSRKEKQKWSIKKVLNHTGSILFLEWSSSGCVLSTNSIDSTSLLLCTLGLFDNESDIKTFQNIEKIITENNFKSNDIINKIECKGYIISHSAFSSSNEKVAIIANSFESNSKKQQIIISEFFKSPANIQFVTWIGQALQKCLFINEQKLLVYGYEMFPIVVEYINDYWAITKVVLPEFNVKGLCVDFFYDKKNIQDIEAECENMDGNEIVSEIIAHSNNILQMSLLKPDEYKQCGEFVTVSSDFNIVIWSFSL